ncbi:galactose oxidase-like domain-containing protein [Nonomuraea wenchangensis]|uniref:galactose oxidase-like domain-containing protein n=1 Tax=Nonomuraea wenchangensis TaxID=568860 RepID=UPI0037134257
MPDMWERVTDADGEPLLCPVLPVHAALLPSGKVVFFSGSEHDEMHLHEHGFASGLWDPDRPTQVTKLDAPQVDLFCAGHSMLANGDVFVAGGTANYDREPDNPHAPYHFTGVTDCHVFHWRTERWSRAEDMAWPRWYPTCVTLADGTVLTMSGHGGPLQPGHEVLHNEIFDPAAGRWQRHGAMIPELEDTGRFWLFGSRYPMIYYPRLHALRDGTVFCATAHQERGGDRRTRRLSLRSGALDTLGPAPPGMRVWWPPDVYARAAFTSVLLPLRPPHYEERVLIAGGQRAWVFDAGTPRSGWRQAGQKRDYSLRAYATAVLLPDGSVLLINGGSSEKLLRWYWPTAEVGGDDKDANPVPERYLPDEDRWERGAKPGDYTPIPRMYHSVALLLASGRVWIAGSNHDSQRNRGGVRADHPHHGDARELRMELYSPPYLFDGVGPDGKPRPAARPEITVEADHAGYGRPLKLTSPHARSIERVTLLRCASVTHAYSSDQRLIELEIAGRTQRELTVITPPDPYIGIPGYYLLFALTARGTPSAGHMLRLG